MTKPVAPVHGPDRPHDRRHPAPRSAGQVFQSRRPNCRDRQNADEFSTFFATVRTAGDKPLPVWRLPAGRRSAREIRCARPRSSSPATSRWSSRSRHSAGQALPKPCSAISTVGAARCSSRQSARTTRARNFEEIKAGDTAITLVDLKGRFQSGGMTPPFASGPPFAGGNAPAPAGGNSATPNLPSNHPPVGPSTAHRPRVSRNPALPNSKPQLLGRPPPGANSAAQPITSLKVQRPPASPFPSSPPMRR